MNEFELRTQHPDLFAAVVASTADRERERAEAHVLLAEASGASPLPGIQSAQGAAEWLGRYQAAAVRNDRVADLERAIGRTGVTAHTAAADTDPEGAAADAIIARNLKRPGATAQRSADLGDRVASAMFGAPQVPATTTTPATVPAADVGDRMVGALNAGGWE